MENLAVYLMTRFLHEDLNLFKLLFYFRSIYYLKAVANQNLSLKIVLAGTRAP